MHDGPRSLSALMVRDGQLRGIAFAFVFLGLAAAAVVWTILALLGVADIWVKIVFLPPLLIIPGLVLSILITRSVRTLRERLAILRRLADHGVVLDAQLTKEVGTPATLRRGGGWSGTKTRHSETLQLLVDPEHPSARSSWAPSRRRGHASRAFWGPRRRR